MPEGSFQLQHLFALCSRIDLALYRGNPEAATPLIEAAWKPMRRSLIDRPPLHQLLVNSTFGRHALACAVAAPVGSSRRKEALATARRYAKKSKHPRMPLMNAAAVMLEGAVYEIEGRTELAIAAYRKAAAGMDERETMLFSHAVRARLGPLVGGDEGAAITARATTWLEGQGARDPATMFAMLLPGPR
jgi:hypothetical protein